MNAIPRPNVRQLCPRPNFSSRERFAAGCELGPYASRSQEFSQIWERWLNGLTAWRILGGTHGAQILLALDQSAVAEIEEAFAASPSLGYALHCLATQLLSACLTICLGRKQDCLPLARPWPETVALAQNLGLEFSAEATLKRGYTLFGQDSQGCKSCLLLENCPKIGSNGKSNI